MDTLCAQLLLQFYADPFELHKRFEHGLKMIIFITFCSMLNFAIFLAFYYQSEWIVGTLCAHILLQFYIDSFETSQVFWTWSEDMHLVWILSSDYFCITFSAS